jgi:hypothetical protein
MFQALLAHPQEVSTTVYCVCVMSVGCGTVAVKLQPCHIQVTLYTCSVPSTVRAVLAEDEQVMLETYREGFDFQ